MKVFMYAQLLAHLDVIASRKHLQMNLPMDMGIQQCQWQLKRQEDSTSMCGCLLGVFHCLSNSFRDIDSILVQRQNKVNFCNHVTAPNHRQLLGYCMTCSCPR